VDAAYGRLGDTPFEKGRLTMAKRGAESRNSPEAALGGEL